MLEGVDLELRPGELVLLAGGSASGKTSLLRCANGLVPRSYRGSARRGELRVAGEEPARVPAHELGTRVGTLLQDPARQVVGHDVRAELAFGPENLGLPRGEVERRVARAARRLALEDLLGRETAELSGGELQRVALAGVLAMEPPLLLLDEPLAALDPASALETARLLRELADEGRALLVVEHRVEALAAARPDRAVELAGGRLAFDGPFRAWLERADPRRAHLPADAAVARWRALGPAPDEPATPAPARDAAPALELRGVGFAWPGGARALEAVDLALAPGERLALLGANGSGKSTLLRVAMGLLAPAAGSVLLRGRDARGLSPREVAREVGFAFQHPGDMLFADTVEEECRFGPRALGFDPAEERAGVERALARFRLEHLRAAAPGALSLGQQKRVALAAVAAAGPTLWLADEPTAGLDPEGVADFLRALTLAQGERGALLFATHDLDLALLAAHRVAVLDRGRLVAVGTPAEVLLDAERLARARLVPTGLLAQNRGRLERGLPPLSARALAAQEGAP